MGGSNFFLRQKNTNLIEGDHTRLANRHLTGQHPLEAIYRESDNTNLKVLLDPVIIHQSTPTQDVTIEHSRDKVYPRVVLLEEDMSTEFEAEVSYIDANNIRIKTNVAINFYVIIY